VSEPTFIRWNSLGSEPFSSVSDAKTLVSNSALVAALDPAYEGLVVPAIMLGLLALDIVCAFFEVLLGPDGGLNTGRESVTNDVDQESNRTGLT
jgi:hypothetical protein